MRFMILMVLSALCLATIGLFVKLIGDGIPIMALNFLRMFIAFIFLALIMLKWDLDAFKESKKNLGEYFGIGVIIAIAFSLFNAANLYAPIQNAVLLSWTSPFFVLIFARLILKERITKKKIITLIIAFIGLLIMNPFNAGSYLIGNSMALSNAVFFALFLTLLRKEEEKHDLGDIMWFFFFASLVLLPFALLSGFGNFLAYWKELLGLGIISTGMAYLLMNLAMRKIEAEQSSIITMIITPIVSIMLAVLILNESLDLKILIGGGVLIFAGIFLQLMNHKHKRPNKK